MNNQTLLLSQTVRPKVGFRPGGAPSLKRPKLFRYASACKLLIALGLVFVLGGFSLVAEWVRFSDAQASSLEALRPLEPNKPPQSIVLKENSGMIVGQFAKIDPQSDQGIVVSIARNSRRTQGEELLSIVGKY